MIFGVLKIGILAEQQFNLIEVKKMFFPNIEMPSAYYDKDMLTELLGDGVPEGSYGYVLVRDHLVPFAFIERLKDHLLGHTFPYSQVYSAQEIVGSDFWCTLNDDERHVVGDCLLILVQQGRIAVYFANTDVEEESDDDSE